MNALAGPLYVIVGVLAVAGVAKLFRPDAAATALRVLNVPSPRTAARVLGATEVAVALAALFSGHPVLWAGIVLFYGAFTVFVLFALRSGSGIGSCGCFGREDTPPTPGHAAFNAAAATLAGLAVASPVRLSDFDGSTVEAVVFGGLVAVGVYVCVLALTALPRTLAIAAGKAPEPAAPFSLTNSSRPPKEPTE